MNDIFSKLIILILLGIIIYYLSINNKNNSFETFNISNKIDKNIPLKSLQKKSTVINPINNNNIFKDNNSRSMDNPINNNKDNNSTYMDNPLINYSGINEVDIGADLNNAFEPPIENKQLTNDIIDFNKHNIEKYNVKDYLPKEINKEWFDTDFSNARNVNDDNLINPDRFIIGINTIGQSLKSPSWDIRGTIANPKYTVSPWGNSTYEPDYNLKSLC